MWTTLFWWLWILLLLYITIMICIPIGYGKKKFLNDPVINHEEKQTYKDEKNQLMTLAGFTITALAIIMALPSITGNKINLLATFYFSISLSCFFAGSYLFDYRIKRIFPYIGQVAEYTGVISLGLAFLSFAYSIFSDVPSIMAIFSIFMGGIVTISFVEIYYNKKFFEPYTDDGKK